MDTLAQIMKLRDARGWSNYKLARMSGISENSLNNLFRRNNLPTLPTLKAVCGGLGITLSQFFAEDGEPMALNAGQMAMLSLWDSLTDGQKESLLLFLSNMMAPDGQKTPVYSIQPDD